MDHVKEALIPVGEREEGRKEGVDMPFRSKSQMRKFGAMLSRGEISKKKFDEWAHATKNIKKLPEKVKKKKKGGK